MTKHRSIVFVRRAGRLLALLAAAALLAGCNTTPRRDPGFAASYPAPLEVPQARQAATGSIYQAGYDVVLFEDSRARRIGDILTIRLTESTNATKSQSNDISKDHETSIDNPTILGANPAFGLPGLLPLSDTDNNTLETEIGGNTQFKGESDTAQRNSLSGDISVTVADVLPNGNLVVRGEKRLNLNSGNEYVKIAGIVRPLDIAANNVVPSTKVADATIIYTGEGAESDATKMGWLGRFFTSALFPL
ncbi:MAG TPA: flagellar basal body L-ring protein FlgH [Gammaproteobacteria bacterium]|nr:flagellar basal body L-ring protein FlgH [Gammaproteobacteria bacterium]